MTADKIAYRATNRPGRLASRPPADKCVPAAPLLTVNGLCAGYGAVQVLWEVSFDVRPGEIVTVVGANGAGKSTLLRTISGLVVPTGGSIAIEGQEIGGHSTDAIVRLGISQAPEGRRLFGGLTVEENLRLGAFGRPGKSRRVVADALETVYGHFPQLRERRRQLAGTLSGGEQQMCAIGRALMANPRLLLIDELSLGLAPLIVQELIQILGGIHEAGTTIFLVEQDVSIALDFADRGVVLERGHVAMYGHAQELLRNEGIVRTYLGEG